MDKKKIYIIVIVLCLAVTAGVLYYGFGPTGTTPEVPLVPINTNTSGQPQSGQPRGSAAGVANIPSVNDTVAYPVPVVFPSDTNLDLSVYDSAKFNALQDYTPLTVTPEEMGRDNPFAPYAGN